MNCNYFCILCLFDLRESETIENIELKFQIKIDPAD